MRRRISASTLAFRPRLLSVRSRRDGTARVSVGTTGHGTVYNVATRPRQPLDNSACGPGFWRVNDAWNSTSPATTTCRTRMLRTDLVRVGTHSGPTALLALPLRRATPSSPPLRRLTVSRSFARKRAGRHASAKWDLGPEPHSVTALRSGMDPSNDRVSPSADPRTRRIPPSGHARRRSAPAHRGQIDYVVGLFGIQSVRILVAEGRAPQPALSDYSSIANS